MRILGIDPGLAIVGYSVLDVVGNRMQLLEYGCITTDSSEDFPKRLDLIYEELNNIINQYQPEELAIEELFFYRNVTNAIKVGQARGVCVLAGTQNKLDVYEYTPMQIKLSVTGYGHADKEQVQETVQMLLKLSEIPKPDDAADAIAVAICHGLSLKNKAAFRME